MDVQELGAILSGMVRVGYVTDVNNDKRIARVRFDEFSQTSDWLPVLINRDFIPDYDVPQKTQTRSGGEGDAAFEEHDHDLIIRPYMPKVNDQVLAIYLPVRNAQGFILGGIQPWQ
ncbi:MAG: hypothetical protein IKC03_08870 [Oscillospiraceae bacterium]|nr:hypothetical protein [Oscillospiraceae bacterium]